MTSAKTLIPLQYIALILTALCMAVGCASSSATVTSPDGADHAVEGKASWYGEQFHGRQTASGETYDMHAHTAAHRTLPFGTRVRVDSKNGAGSVVVRITDRGPFVDGRIIDLSYAAARELSMIQAGILDVELEILGW